MNTDDTGHPPLDAPKPGCGCYACGVPAWELAPGFFMRTTMNLCARCGNKRCPGAADHRNECTGSNEPGQPGSLYA